MNPEVELASLGLTVKRTDPCASGPGPTARLDCPFCQGSEALGIVWATGVWTCHKCHEKGNLFQLRRRLRGEAPRVSKPVARKPRQHGRTIDAHQVEDAEKALVAEVEALEYLKKTRGFTEATIQKFRLGARRVRRGLAIAIPYLVGGVCQGTKYRLLPPNDQPHKYEREPGCVLPLFGEDQLKGEFQRVAILEGELDAVAWAQYDLGIPGVSLPNGATADLDDAAAEALVAFDEVLLVTDQDDAGETGAEKLAERLGAFRCRRVRLPAKDANECLTSGVTKEQMLAAIAGSSPLYQSNVKPLVAWQEALLAGERTGMHAKLTGWVALDKLLGGLRPGEVTLLTAETGAGKTTWTLDLARRQAALGHAALVASLELPSVVVARKLLSGIAGRLWNDLSPDDLGHAVQQLGSQPLYLLDRYGAMDVTRLRAEVEYAVRRHGVSLVVIDHLHFMLGVRKAHDDERVLIDQTAMDVQNLALDLGIHVVLVMHPAKIRAERGKTREPDIGDLKGSSGPGQFADNVARLSRREGDRAVLTLLKVRSELGRMGSVTFAFDPDSLHFTDVNSSAKPRAPAEPHWSEPREPGDDSPLPQPPPEGIPYG